MKTCPRCNFKIQEEQTKCPNCDVVFAQWATAHAPPTLDAPHNIPPSLYDGSGHEYVGETAIYRYPKSYSMAALIAILGFGAMATILFIVSVIAQFAPLAPLGASVLLLAMSYLIYLYLDRFCIHIDSRTLKIISLFPTKVIYLRLVAKIMPMWLSSRRGGKTKYLTLCDKSNRELISISENIQDFNSLVFDIERHTRSPDVILYKKTEEGWQEKTNEEHSSWHPCKEPGAPFSWSAVFTFIFVVLGVIYTFYHK